MSQDSTLTDSAPRIRCAEVWGGNHSIYAPVLLPGLEGMLYSRSCSGGRGGDVHYLSMCGSGLLSRICIADVMGHGEQVSRVGQQAHELLRRHVNWPDHRRFLRRLNESLEREGIHALTTAAVLTYYPPSRRLSFSYAGHPPAWHFSSRRDDWRRLILPEDTEAHQNAGRIFNIPLAVRADTVYSRSRLRIEAGDRLLLVTDGVLEAPDAALGLFGNDGVERVLARHRRSSLRALSDALLNELAAHCSTSEFRHDDVSFLILEFTAPLTGPPLWHVLRNRVLRRLGVVRDPGLASASA